MPMVNDVNTLICADARPRSAKAYSRAGRMMLVGG